MCFYLCQKQIKVEQTEAKQRYSVIIVVVIIVIIIIIGSIVKHIVSI